MHLFPKKVVNAPFDLLVKYLNRLELAKKIPSDQFPLIYTYTIEEFGNSVTGWVSTLVVYLLIIGSLISILTERYEFSLALIGCVMLMKAAILFAFKGSLPGILNSEEGKNLLADPKGFMRKREIEKAKKEEADEEDEDI